MRDDEPLNPDNSTSLADLAALNGAGAMHLSASESPAERAKRQRAMKRLEQQQARKTRAAKKAGAKANGATPSAVAPEPEVTPANVGLTLATNDAGLAAKVFWQGKDGKIEGRSAASIYQGRIVTAEVDSLDAFMAMRTTLTSRQAFIYGTSKHREARLVTQKELGESASAEAVIARTQDYLSFASGRPGIFMLDCDVREGHPPKHWKDLDAILCGTAPGWSKVMRAWTQSSTSSIRTTDGVDEIGMGGWRCYVIVDDASKIADVGAFIYQALWGAGHGYVTVSRSGQVLDRSLVDAAVWKPERLDFAAPPHLGPGLERTEVETAVVPGAPMLETAELVPKLSMAQWRKTSRKLKAARKEVRAEAAKARATFEAEMFAAVMKRVPDADVAAVRASIRRAVEEQELSGHWPLHAQDGTIVTVAELLTDPNRWDGVHFADPMEPTYRGDNRIAWACLKPEAGEPFIYSHARGGRRYRLLEESESDEEPLLPAPGHPMGCARRFVEARLHHPERPLVLFQGGQFYRWDRTCWPVFDEKDVRTQSYRFTESASYMHVAPDGSMERKPWQPTQRKIGDFVDALRAVAAEPTSIPSPSWLSGDEPYPAKEMVACTNGLVHIPTRTLIPHTPRFYTHHAVPFAFDPDAPEPVRWLEFLLQLWPNDAESIRALQEIFGYLVAGDTSLQKMFLLVGPKRGGKGTIGRVLKALLGEHNVCGPTLSSLGTNFGLEPLIGKTLALISDARLGGKTDSSVVAERTLSISGEDTLTVDRKYQVPVTLQLPTRFLVLSNELPRLKDASGALASRFITLILQQSFYGKENPTLTQTLLKELPGVFNWALDGAQRLSQRGHFVTPKASQEAVREMEDLGSPVAAFVRERCEVGPTKSIAVDALYADYRAWCIENGHEHISTKEMFGRDLRSAQPGLKKVRGGSDGDRATRYEGIGRKVL
jgi:putative DNA primase/helicase